MKKFLIILAVIFVIAGIALFTAAMASEGFDFKMFEMEEYVTESFDVTDSFTEVSIKAVTCDVCVKKSADGGVHVETVLRKSFKPYVNVENNVLVVKVEEPARQWFSIGINWPRINVYLPSELYDITVSLSTGDTSVSGIDAGVIRVKCTTGDTEISSVHCAEIDTDGSTGDVLLRDVTVEGKMSVKCTTGDIRIDSIDASEIYFTTTTGDISGTVLTEKQFKTKTSTGDISVPKTAEGGICEIRTTTGDIKIRIK